MVPLLLIPNEITTLMVPLLFTVPELPLSPPSKSPEMKILSPSGVLAGMDSRMIVVCPINIFDNEQKIMAKYQFELLGLNILFQSG